MMGCSLLIYYLTSYFQNKHETQKKEDDFSFEFKNMPKNIEDFKAEFNDMFLYGRENDIEHTLNQLTHYCDFLDRYLKQRITKKEFNELVNECFIKVCAYQLEYVKYLILFSPIKNNIDISYKNFAAINMCCFHNNLEVLKFLVSIRDINIHTENDYPIRIACDKGYLELIEFLLTSQELKEHSDIHALEDYALKIASGMKRNDVIDYLIFNYQIEMTKSIQQYIKAEKELFGHSMLEPLFNRRELNKNLKKELEIKPNFELIRQKI